MRVQSTVEFYKNHRIHLIFKGELDVDSLRPTLAEADLLIAQLREGKQPVLILADTTELEEIKLATRKHGVAWLKKADYDKVAVHGSSMFMKYFVGMLIRVLKKQHEVLQL